MSYKCIINEKNEIEGFYEDGSKAPSWAVDCDNCLLYTSDAADE